MSHFNFIVCFIVKVARGMCPCEMGENLKKVPDAAETRAPVGANNIHDINLC